MSLDWQTCLLYTDCSGMKADLYFSAVAASPTQTDVDRTSRPQRIQPHSTSIRYGLSDILVGPSRAMECIPEWLLIANDWLLRFGQTSKRYVDQEWQHDIDAGISILEKVSANT